MPSIPPAPRSFKEVFRSLSPRRRWRGESGYKNLLGLALPMMASQITVAATLFINRLVLSRHSLEAIAASLPAGVAYVTVTAFFQGLVSYVSVFAAQYAGAGRPDRAAAALWQSLYLALIAGLLVALTFFAAPFLFGLGGHPPRVLELEVLYYRILCLPAVLNLGLTALASFLAGLGRARTVMWVNLLGALVNAPLTYVLVFGWRLGEAQIIESRGVAGAAAADVLTWLIVFILFALIAFSRRSGLGLRRAARRLDGRLFRRLVAYGSPGGLQRFLELAAFAFFTFSVGRLGAIPLAANNIVFSIELLSFFPMLGVGASVSILVGRAIGRGRPDEAAEAMWSGVGASSVFTALLAAAFLVFPEALLGLFISPGQDPDEARRIMDLGVVLLRFVALYTLFDGLYLCVFGALSGAGDVWFPMAAMGLGGLFCLALPIGLLFRLEAASLNNLWIVFVVYIFSLNASGSWRYRQGAWRNKKVIEKTA